jgi:cytidylate kinase
LYIAASMPWYNNLVDRMFEQKQIVEQMAEHSENLGLEFKPFITISRDPGGGGKPIAMLVAKKLNFKFYDRQLIDEIAKSADARLAIMKAIDEKDRTQTEDFIHNLLNPEYITERHYIKHLCKVVLTLARKGKAVILGRGSNFITPRAFGLHVRVTAPYRVCVARAVQFEHVPYHKARDIIRKTMAERSAFVKEYFGKDITNPKYYDMTLNTTYMNLEDAAETIIMAFHRKFPQA